MANIVYTIVGKKVGGTADPFGGDIGWLLSLVSRKLSGDEVVSLDAYVFV